MKWINFIVSIYLVALSCLPCGDVATFNIENLSEKLNTAKENHSHEKENDLCSPFCNCNCCGTQIANYYKVTTINFTIVSKSIKTQLPSYKSKFISKFYGSIWQPPQIV